MCPRAVSPLGQHLVPPLKARLCVSLPGVDKWVIRASAPGLLEPNLSI